MEEKVDLNSCRICLATTKVVCPLFKYKLSGNYAEMLTSVADVKVSADDGLPNKLCYKCCMALEKAFLLKTVAERSDRKLRTLLEKRSAQVPKKKIAFNSISDIKSEIGPLSVKNEPKWEMEIEVLGKEPMVGETSVDSMACKDIVIANTVIKKVDGKDGTALKDFCINEANVSWRKVKAEPHSDTGYEEYLDDNVFDDNGFDEDYVPPSKKATKTGFKKPIKVLKDNTVIKRVKVVKNITKDGKCQVVTCYPVKKNGSKGDPIYLKRPKDANIITVDSNFKFTSDKKSVVKAQPIKVVKSPRTVMKSREKLVCPVCGILTHTLGNHMSTHEEKKKFTCSECNKSFSQKGNLTTHLKHHIGVKDHICEICGAGFYCQKGLVRHNLIHKGERPFPCTLCNKRFIVRCDLNRHMRIHSGYKPYKCSTCTMSFNAKHQLQNHERMHTGERPYTCQICNVAFSYKVNLNNHVYKVHGINLKFKSIHVVTEEVLKREMELTGEARISMSQLVSHLTEAPPAAAHETIL